MPVKENFTNLNIGYKETEGLTTICISGSDDLTPENAMKMMAYVLAYIDEKAPGVSGIFLEKLQLDKEGTLDFYDTALFKQGTLYKGKKLISEIKS